MSSQRSTTSSTRPPKPTFSAKSPNPARRATRLSARLKTLTADFANLKVDIETQKFLLTLINRSGNYCQTCSPLNKVGTCGPTCALLRPGGGHTILVPDKNWARDTLRRTCKWKAAVDDLNRRGQNMSAFELKELKEMAKKMGQEVLSVNERWSPDFKVDVGVDFREIDWEGKKKRRLRRESKRRSRSESQIVEDEDWVIV